MEIIRYNIEKLGGIESTVASTPRSPEMQPSLMSYEMKNIEKNMERVNQRAAHPRHFDSQAAFAEAPSGPRQQFPFGGAGGADPRAGGQFSASNRPLSELSNYPGTRG